jgi:hypothetical protein
MYIKESVIIKGEVKIKITYADGTTEEKVIKNTILRKGREALAKCLANKLNDTFDFFVSRMIFGDGGTNSGVPKFVNTERNGLFGTTRVSKPVIATIDPNLPSKIIFTSVVGFSEGNGFALNEMALMMDNGDLYSMVTFPDLNKTSNTQITWDWSISFI